MTGNTAKDERKYNHFGKNIKARRENPHSIAKNGYQRTSGHLVTTKRSLSEWSPLALHVEIQGQRTRVL